jgi:S1-C subfamily serine protease
MKTTLIASVITCLFSLSASAQNKLTSGDIYRLNHEAVVQINVGESFSGDGFLISSDGIIATANHVVATRDSHFREYSHNLSVVAFSGNTFRAYPAVPIVSPISADQANYDYAFLKITGNGFSHVQMGDWNQIEIGSSLVIIPSFPNVGPSMMLEGTVSGKAQGFNPDLGPKPFNTFVFQCPVRKGFSGAPIFNSKGIVVGIVDTEVFGISPALDEQRKKWAANNAPNASSRVTITIGTGGADIGASILELINNLDQNLISGLGSGVDIPYAKEQQKDKGHGH